VSALILDAGAFIALDRDNRTTWTRLNRAIRAEQRVVTHAGIVGQVWRHPSRQARLARALKSVEIVPITLELARASGLLLAATRRDDVHDAALALLCEPDDIVITSDTDDMVALLAERGMQTVGVVRP
jgi:hypothetical protein